MLYQRGGGLLPLGGEGELLSGYKGYGLAEVVDILTAILSGGVFGQAVIDSQATSARVCHFFGALRLDLFRDPEAIKFDMDRLLNELEKAEPAEGCQRVYYAGLKEHEAEVESARLGVQISEKVASQLRQIGEELGVELAGIF
jgi:LDH2 family malate/lactate/ureidoglycolate dehydrogenase